MKPKITRLVEGLQIFQTYYGLDHEKLNEIHIYSEVDNIIFGPSMNTRFMLKCDIEKLEELGWNSYLLSNGKSRWKFDLS